MRLFLIRHGETVDNVAGIYAGTRNSPLTSHGILQARRLATHLATHHPRITHIFSSDLRRAVETAQAIVDAQPSSPSLSSSAVAADGDGDGGSEGRPLEVIQLPDLRERDFGTAEGRKFGVSLADAGVESREQMRVRAARVVRGRLVPLFCGQAAEGGGAIVVVAHGLILDVLLRVLVTRFGPAEMAQRSGYLATWNNTGYVEIAVRVRDKALALDTEDGVSAEAAVASGDRKAQQQPKQERVSLTVVGVNVLRHLEGLKKTRGGIGSAQHDKRQRTVDSFFAPASKKPKVE